MEHSGQHSTQMRANQLRDEFNTLLFAAIARTDKHVAVALPVCSMSFAL
jgi:hypothetical protein